eukprot:Hpha_TRINITY_DN7074_c0_g1::TRINITY_DN7074_c0_g1_i1::g.22959::m.22959
MAKKGAEAAVRGVFSLVRVPPTAGERLLEYYVRTFRLRRHETTPEDPIYLFTQERQGTDDVRLDSSSGDMWKSLPFEEKEKYCMQAVRNALHRRGLFMQEIVPETFEEHFRNFAPAYKKAVARGDEYPEKWATKEVIFRLRRKKRSEDPIHLFAQQRQGTDPRSDLRCSYVVDSSSGDM